MVKQKNPLFVNYERQIGRRISANYNGVSINQNINAVPPVTAFPEYLVPGAAKDELNTLTAIGNSIYVEARSKNMSLSPFGHLDPIKIVIATAFLPCMMAEIKRDLEIACTYQFEATAFGKGLALAANFDLDDALQQYANYIKQFNVLAGKINSLYVPVSGLTARWMPHRRNVYKDDEGSRYSMYLYNMGNYYELDVDATSPTVGQVLCKFTDMTNKESIGVKLQRINTIVDNYLGDTDVASFCTEAIQAGMSRIVIDSIGDSNNIPVLKMQLCYDLDDILSLENATFISPVTVVNAFGIAGCNWDIVENISLGTLEVGRIGNNKGILPVCGKLDTIGLGNLRSDQVLAKYQNFGEGMVNTEMADIPIFSHAKITSTEGLTKWLRYKCSWDGYTFDATLLPGGGYAYINGIQITCGFSGVILVTGVEVRSTEMVGSPLFYHQDASLGWISTACQRYFNGYTLDASNQTLVVAYLTDKHYRSGLKTSFFSLVYEDDSGDLFVDSADFDYVVYLDSDTVATFHNINAWNDCQLIGKIDKSE